MLAPRFAAIAAPGDPGDPRASRAVFGFAPAPKGGDFGFGASDLRLASFADADAQGEPRIARPDREPFGYRTVLAPPGALWTKWGKVEAGIRAEAPELARCRLNFRHCSSAAARFVAIVRQAARRQGRERLEWVNEEVNSAIAYATVSGPRNGPRVWTAPFGPDHDGAFASGQGDCKDYAIAKYVALLGSGTPAEDLRLLIVRDTSVDDYHAVLAVRDENGWVLLDNRWSRLVEEREASFFAPLFTLDQQGVKRFAAADAPAKVSTPAASRGGAPALRGALQLVDLRDRPSERRAPARRAEGSSDGVAL